MTANATSQRILPQGSTAITLDEKSRLAFDDAVLAKAPEAGADQVPYREVPPGHVWFANGAVGTNPGLCFVDVREYFNRLHAKLNPYSDDWVDLLDEFNSINVRGLRSPRPRPLFLGWEFENVDSWVTSAIARLTAIRHLTFPEYMDSGGPRSLEAVDDNEPLGTWRVRPEVIERCDQLAMLATDLLPDFIDGSIQSEFRPATGWEGAPRVRLYFVERGGGKRRWLEDFGKGASRWMAIAVQVALRIMEQDSGITAVNATGSRAFSDQVLLVDEPEAHLHPSAVASVVRWCQRMVGCGFTVVAASHHEQFLRASGDQVTFVKVSRDVESSATTARTLLSSAAPLLQELAKETGMHPATVMSLHRAVLFVEGTLDVAVLQEFAGFSLEAAGVLIIPMGGTNNLVGLIDGEFAPRLGMKVGVLTDNTIVATMDDRSEGGHSHEEKKLLGLLKRFEETGATPPKRFGVPEDDLLHALPADAIREHFNPAFPGWQELKREWQAAKARNGQVSKNWKAYAETAYGVPIKEPDGVRRVVSTLDLAGVELPSLQSTVDAIIDWARES